MGRPLSTAQFEDLYRATAKDIFTYVRRRSTMDAEDVVAETYAIAWRRRSDMPAPTHRRAWLFGIARTLLLAEHRRRQRERDTLNDAAHALTTSHAVEGTQVSAGDSTIPARAPNTNVAEPLQDAALEAAMDRLTPMQKEVLRLTAWECLTPGELAVALGIRPGVARVRLHRARQALAADPQVQALLARRHSLTNR